MQSSVDERRSSKMAEFIRVGQYLINPENVAYIEEKDTTSILVYFTGSEKAPIHISGVYAAGLLQMLKILSIQIPPGYQANPNLQANPRLKELLKKQEDSGL
jgi:hypothetical protein